VGAVTVHGFPFDTSPLGLATAIRFVAIPPVMTQSDAGIAAVSVDASTKVVGRAAPFHVTTDRDVKFVPLTVRVNAPLFAVIVAGERLLTLGARTVSTA
jgi:hypothetical protein